MFICFSVCNVYAQSLQGAGGMQDINQMVGGNSALSNADVLSLLNPAANTVGTRLFLGKWMKGVVTTSGGTIVHVDSVLYAYDKISNNLYYTTNDKKTIMEADVSQITSFDLEDQGNDYHFVHVPLINPVAFFQQLVVDSAGFSLYKLITTTFVAADFRNNGYYTTGSTHNQYLNKDTYYIVFPGNSSYKEIFLRKHAIREIFGKSNPLLKSFFSQNEEDVDENYLIHLVKYLNGKKR